MSTLLKNMRPISKYLQQTTTEVEFIFQCVFSEKYSFVVQDAAQSFHWNKNQESLLTLVFHSRDGIAISH